MCGIVGSIQTGEHVPLRDAVRRAMDHMVHRGPDGQGLEEFRFLPLLVDAAAFVRRSVQ